VGDNDTTVIRTDFDLATMVLSQKIAPEIIEYAHKRIYIIKDLYKEKANKTELLSNFIWSIPTIVFGFSHGVEDALLGQEIVQNVLDLSNTAWVNNKIVILNACDCGKKLAPAMIDAGARAVFAYDDLLTLRVIPKTYEPLEGFKESINTPKLLYDGLKAKEVYNKTIEEYDKWIDYWDEEDPVTADVLRHDRDHFKLYGNGESSITFSSYLFLGLTDIFAIAWVMLSVFREIVRAVKPLWKKT